MEWKLRIKGSRGIQIVDIEAADRPEAEAVGRAYVRAHGPERLLFVQIDGPRVVAGPEILTSRIARDMPADAEPLADGGTDEGERSASPKPTLEEQRERLAARRRGTDDEAESVGAAPAASTRFPGRSRG